MAFTFAAFSYIIALIVDAFLIFFAIFHVSVNYYQILNWYDVPIISSWITSVAFTYSLQIIAFDELKTDYKNPIDQCQSLNPLVLPEYIMHAFFNVLFLVAGKKNGYIIFASSGSYLYPDFRKYFRIFTAANILMLYYIFQESSFPSA